jgi:hypothetical protein
MTIRDGAWELFDYDFQTGRSVWRYFDGEKTTFRTDYPVDDLIKQNAFTRNETSGNQMGDWVKIASVPLNVAYDAGLVQAQTEGDQQFVKKWLNDGDNRAWRSFDATV